MLFGVIGATPVVIFIFTVIFISTLVILLDNHVRHIETGDKKCDCEVQSDYSNTFYVALLCKNVRPQWMKFIYNQSEKHEARQEKRQNKAMHYLIKFI